MALREDQLKTVEALILNAETICDLYKLYANKFPEYKDFWLGLATEATDQASSIRTLRDKVEDGSIYFNTDGFAIQTIESFLKYLQEKIDEVKKQDTTIQGAVVIASNIENSLLEKRFFDIFEADSVELKHVFLDLAGATEKRRNKLEALLAAKKTPVEGIVDA